VFLRFLCVFAAAQLRFLDLWIATSAKFSVRLSGIRYFESAK
jgi:hypothetical protein